jgi:serine/threonine protein kinase
MLILECKQGLLQNGKMIAVKKFKLLRGLDVMETQFKNEVFALMSLKHPNIVRCVGYCFNTRRRIITHNEKLIIVESPEMLLCLEYLTRGSLDEHLKGTAIEYFFFFQLLGFQIMRFVSIFTTAIPHSINIYH